MNEAALMMALRFLHIIAGALWVGAVFFLAAFAAPAIAESGPAGWRIMQVFAKRRLGVFMGAMPGLVLITGLAMYIRASMLTQGAFARSHMGMAFGLGAVLAILAGVTGGSVTGRTAEALEKLGSAVLAAGGTPSPAEQQELSRLQTRLVTSSRIVAGLVLGATALMAIARYL